MKIQFKHSLKSPETNDFETGSRWLKFCHLLLVVGAFLTLVGVVGAQTTGDNLSVNLTLPEADLIENQPFPIYAAVCNDGTPAVFALVLRDEIPSNMIIQSVTANRGTCAVDGQIVTCTVPQLESTQCVEVEIIVLPEEPGIETNRFSMRAGDDVVAVPNESATLKLHVRKLLDYGDAPGSYPTLRSTDGARHRILSGWHLGGLIDSERDGRPDIDAMGDDVHNLLDEDGVRFLTQLPIGGTATIEVVSSTNAFLDAWIDFDMDWAWEPAEQIFTSQPLVRGVNILTFNVPPAINWKGGQVGLGHTYSRFRMSRYGGLKPNGYAAAGEVEDYRVRVGELAGPIDWEMVPAEWGSGSTETITVIARNVGADTLHDVTLVDEIPASMAIQSATCSAGSCTVAGQVVTVLLDEMTPAQYVTLQVVVVPEEEGTFLNAVWGYEGPPVVPDSLHPEVTPIIVSPLRDFGDAPDPSFPTLLANNGARHLIVRGWYLGKLIDSEPDGIPYSGSPVQREINATGDDRHNLDDEDGVVFLSTIIPGAEAQIRVESSVAGMLDAWVDINLNGTWEPVEQIFTSRPLVRGYNYLSFPVNALGGGGQEGWSYARFRLSRDGGLTPEGYAPIGEVEDYQVYVGGDPDDVPDLDLDIPETRLIEGKPSLVTLTLHNLGDADETHVTVMAELPESVTIHSVSSSMGTCSVAGQTVICQVDRLAANWSVATDFLIVARESGSLQMEVTVMTDRSGVALSAQGVGGIVVHGGLKLHLGENLNNGRKGLLWENEDAVLEEALDVTGPWREIEGAQSPYPIIPDAHQKRFYRLRLDPPGSGSTGTGSSN